MRSDGGDGEIVTPTIKIVKADGTVIFTGEAVRDEAGFPQEKAAAAPRAEPSEPEGEPNEMED